MKKNERRAPLLKNKYWSFTAIALDFLSDPAFPMNQQRRNAATQQLDGIVVPLLYPLRV